MLLYGGVYSEKVLDLHGNGGIEYTSMGEGGGRR